MNNTDTTHGTPERPCIIEAEVHIEGCWRGGFRYGSTRKDGKVIMFCKNSKCTARRIV